jgi:hypothetical protein
VRFSQRHQKFELLLRCEETLQLLILDARCSMRIRIKSAISALPLKCLWELAEDDEDKTIASLVADLKAAFVAHIACDFSLSLDGFLLLPRSRVFGVLHHDDLITLKAADSPLHQSHADLASVSAAGPQLIEDENSAQRRIQHHDYQEKASSDFRLAQDDPISSLVHVVQRLTEKLDSPQKASLKAQEVPASRSSTSSSSVSSSSSDSSSSSSSDSSSDDEVDKDVRAEEAKTEHQVTRHHGLPHNGSERTAKRNDRRRRSRLLQNLIQAGELRKGSTFKDLDRWQVYNYGSKSFGMPTLVQSQGENSAGEEAPSEYGVRQEIDEAEAEDGEVIETGSLQSTTVNPNRRENALPATCLASPEPGWEQHVTVKRIECEAEYVEEDLPVMQYVEHQYVQQESRGKKRKRRGASKIQQSVQLPASIDGSTFDVDLYGDASAEPTTAEALDAVAAAYQLTDDDLPDLPADIRTLKSLSTDAVELRKLNSVIAFRHLVMRNYEPEESDYKTGKIVDLDGDDIKLQLAKRDVEPAQFDYDGNRILGKFEVEGEDDEIEEGVCWISRSELIDPLLLC